MPIALNLKASGKDIDAVATTLINKYGATRNRAYSASYCPSSCATPSWIDWAGDFEVVSELYNFDADIRVRFEIYETPVDFDLPMEGLTVDLLLAATSKFASRRYQGITYDGDIFVDAYEKDLRVVFSRLVSYVKDFQILNADLKTMAIS
jgi:hypothetical protein